LGLKPRSLRNATFKPRCAQVRKSSISATTSYLDSFFEKFLKRLRQCRPQLHETTARCAEHELSHLCWCIPSDQGHILQIDTLSIISGVTVLPDGMIMVTECTYHSRSQTFDVDTLAEPCHETVLHLCARIQLDSFNVVRDEITPRMRRHCALTSQNVVCFKLCFYLPHTMLS
jgi:hypothetical protein